MFHNVCILVFLAFFQPALSRLDLDGAFKNVNERCLKEAGIKPEDFTRYMENPNFFNILEENRACYAMCIGKEQKKIREDGSIDLDVALKDIANEPYAAYFQPTLIKCSKERGINPCETTKKSLKCILLEILRVALNGQPEYTNQEEEQHNAD